MGLSHNIVAGAEREVVAFYYFREGVVEKNQKQTCDFFCVPAKAGQTVLFQDPF